MAPDEMAARVLTFLYPFDRRWGYPMDGILRHKRSASARRMAVKREKAEAGLIE